MRRILTYLLLLLPFAAGAQERPDLRVMSFNILRGDLSAKEKLDWKVRKDACLEMVRTRRPSLLGLQECNSTQRDDILSALVGYGHIGLSVDGDSLFHKVSSNPIYYDKSMFDLEASGVFWFADDPDSPGMYTWNATKPRNASWGKFLHKSTGRHLVYVNMHIQNGLEAVVNRTLSIRLVMEKLREFNPEGYPVICTGDLNSNANEIYYSPMRQVMNHVAETCIKADDGYSYNGFTGKSKTGLIDHIFYRGFKGLEFVVDRDSYAGIQFISDHWPVYADLAFDPDYNGDGPVPFFDREPSLDDVRIDIGTWHIPDNIATKPAQLLSLLEDNGVEVLGVQGLDRNSERLLRTELKKNTKGKYALLSVYSDPMNPKISSVVALIYDRMRVEVEQMNPFWLRDKLDEPGLCWDNATSWGGLAATLKDKTTGKSFFVATTLLPADKGARSMSPAPLKNVDRWYNTDQLPSFLLADFNGPDRERYYMSLLNFWADTYSLQRAERDSRLATQTSDNLSDWSKKTDFVCLRHFIDNDVIVDTHRVMRSESSTPVHYPVISTIVLK